MTAPRRRISLSLAARRLKVTASNRALRRPRSVSASGAAAGVGQRTVKPPRLRGRASTLAEGFDPNRDPFRALREGHDVAAADRAARLVDRRAGLTAHEPHAAFLDDARGQAPRLEKAGAPQPDIDPAAVFRHERARPALCTRLRLRRRVRRSAGFVSAASAANGVATGPALNVGWSDAARRRKTARSAPSPSRTR